MLNAQRRSTGCIAMWLGLFVLASLSVDLRGQDKDAPAAPQIKWQPGPSVAELGGIAEISVPGGYVFAGPKDTRTIMEALQNPTSGDELGFLAPSGEDWFVVFEFLDTGYVRDDEKNSLDADAILKSIKSSNVKANEVRKKKGYAALNVTGWQIPPNYNETTHNLEWAIRGEGEKGEVVINHNTRVLGRRGIMRVTLVTAPEQFEKVLPVYRSVFEGFKYKAGDRYAEFVSGDKVAQYGLTALVAGGAAAVAVKTGLIKYIGKFFIFILAALAALYRRIAAKVKSVFRKPE